MHPSIEQLLKVQGTDNEIRFLGEAMVARPRELEDEGRKLEEAKSRVDAVVEHLKGVRLEIKKGESEVKRCDDEILKAKIALNSAKSNDEFAVLTSQIEKIGVEQGEFEEAVLVQLDEVERLEGMQKQFEDLYAEEEQRYARKKGDIEEIVASLDGKMAAAKVQREEMLEGVNPEHLEMYNRVLQRHGNQAISAVRDRTCTGCQMTVNANEISLMILAEEIVRCRSCSRLLYLDD